MVLIEKIVKLILSNPGIIINTNSLARDFGVSKITISNYLKILETFLILRQLSNFRPSFLSSSRKFKKYYPATTSLIYGFSKEAFEQNFGKVLETYAVNALSAEFYFRSNSREIDIILQKNKSIIPIEVKEKFSEEDTKKLINMSKRFNTKKLFLLTLAEKSKRGNLMIYPIYLTEKLNFI